MNVLVKNLSDVCRERTLEEKWLIAPSLRVGHQWVDAVARSGQIALNLRIKTFKGLILEFAGPELAARGLKWLSATAGEVLADRAWSELARRRNKLRYLNDLHSSRSLPRALYDSLDSLRMAGLTPAQLRPQKFGVREKANDLAKLLELYGELLQKEKRIDYSQAIALACEQLGKSSDAVQGLILIPEDVEESLSAAERKFLELIPEKQRRIVPVDESDAARTKVEIFSAAGEINEVREMLRRCLSREIKLDEVELLHTDNETYLPILFEEAERLGLVGEGGERLLPVTFAEGVPCRFSRLGRALLAWLEWIEGDYPQSILIRMIQDGLLNIPSTSADQFAHIADEFRNVRVLRGADRYAQVFGAHIKWLARIPSKLDETEVEARKQRLGETKRLADFVKGLMDVSPPTDSPASTMLDSAIKFLSTFARSVSEMDNNARNALRIEIEDMRGMLGPTELFGGFDVRAWLNALPGRLRVGGSGPRPGCLHCANYMSGGHSGRPHTFVIGLDDARFPGSGFQDPLLLDNERKSLSDKLETSAQSVHARTHALQRLLARLRGNVTLGYSCRDLQDDRETFPSHAILDAFRALSKNQSADQHDLERALPAPASFVSSDENQNIDASGWWLWRFQNGTKVADAQALVEQHFPHLGRGREAANSRRDQIASEFDGMVTEAGKDMSPLAADGPVMSASSLEQLGRCPLAYFFKYVLDIEPPEDVEVDPRQWLDALTSGRVLHEVFRDYIGGMLNVRPSADEKALLGLLERAIKACVEETPAPSETVFRKEKKDLEQAVRIFLSAKDLFKEDLRPAFLEASVGLRSSDKPTPLDTAEPVAIPVSETEKVRVCGRLDRIDRVGSERSNHFAIVDYKTGSAKKYSKSKPFQEGRVVQHLLYLEMARLVLQKKFEGAKIDAFSYFFAGIRGGGRLMRFQPEDLARGRNVLRNICHIASSGTFLATNNKDDCANCAYQPVCGNVVHVASCSNLKLTNPENTTLQPFRELRAKEDGE